jgi:hypothetical protein
MSTKIATTLHPTDRHENTADHSVDDVALPSRAQTLTEAYQPIDDLAVATTSPAGDPALEHLDFDGVLADRAAALDALGAQTEADRLADLADHEPGDSPTDSGSAPRDPESMLSADKGAGTAGSTIAPVTNDDEGVHDVAHANPDDYGVLGKIGTAIGSGLPSTSTGQALKQATDEIDADSNPDAGAVQPAPGPDDIVSEHESSDGTVYVIKFGDGTTIVADKNNNTTTTTHPDGSTDTRDETTHKSTHTDPLTTPDAEHQGAPLPDSIQHSIDADIEDLRALKPATDDGATDPNPDADPGFGSGSGSGSGSPAGGPIGNPQSGDPGAPGIQDTTSPPAGFGQGAVEPGSNPEFTDPGADDDSGVQTHGPTEPQHHGDHPLADPPPAHDTADADTAAADATGGLHLVPVDNHLHDFALV